MTWKKRFSWNGGFKNPITDGQEKMGDEDKGTIVILNIPEICYLGKQLNGVVAENMQNEEINFVFLKVDTTTAC